MEQKTFAYALQLNPTMLGYDVSGKFRPATEEELAASVNGIWVGPAPGWAKPMMRLSGQTTVGAPGFPGNICLVYGYDINKLKGIVLEVTQPSEPHYPATK